MPASNFSAPTKRSATTALMLPPPAPKRIRRPHIVLDEDTYTSAVSHIIRRDFFPGLAEADAQHDYLNAVHSKDRVWIREAGRKLTQIMTPVANDRRKLAGRTRLDIEYAATDKTPSVWGADTPATVTGLVALDHEEKLSKLDHVDLNMSLGAFQAKYTSEDQESFSQIVDKQNTAKFAKNVWLREGNMYASKQRMAQQRVIEARDATSNSNAQALTSTTRPSQDLDDRSAAPNYHKHTAFNNLMFGPESLETWVPTRAQRAEHASLAPPKQVVYNNTRLPAPSAEPYRPASPTLSAVREAVAGRPGLNASEVSFQGNETPRVNGYAFVDAHPTEPELEEDVPMDLLEKYGLDSGGRAMPFTITESSDREKMHHRMVDQIGAKRYTKSNTGCRKAAGSGLGIFPSGTPRFSSAPTPGKRLAGQTPSKKLKGDLTPAARRLFERVGGGTPNTGGPRGFGTSRVGKEWVPTPSARRKD